MQPQAIPRAARATSGSRSGGSEKVGVVGATTTRRIDAVPAS